MNRKLIAILIANMFLAPAALAETTGSIGLQGFLSNDDAEDKAKFNEYQDADSGVGGIFDLQVRDKRYWMDGYGENIGRDDLWVKFRGGLYGQLRYDLYANWIPHNFTFGARSPFTNIGSANLVAPSFLPPNPLSARGNIASWSTFDIGYDRKDYGGAVEWQVGGPWYVRGAVNQFTFDGTKVMSSSNGTSPGNGHTELPLPIDYKTTNWLVEGGYNTRTLVVSGQFLWSKFENDNQTVSWTNPFWAGTLSDIYTLPADNDYMKFSLNGAWRGLPANSTLSARFTRATQESDVNILQTMLSGVNVTTPTNPNAAVFDGKEDITTFSASWAFAPTRQFDGRAFYNYYDRNNDSTHIVFTGPLAADTEFYDVKKNHFGIEGGYRFAPNIRVMGGYDYLKKDQERPDYDEVTDNRFFAELKYGFEVGAARLKYQYSTRDSNHIEATIGTGPTDPLFLQRFVDKFDSAKRNQNLLKVSADFTPTDMLDFGFEYIWKINDYDETLLGRTKDKRHEFYVNVGFGDPKGLRLSVFGDLEKIEYDSYHRAISNTGAPDAFDPFAAPNSSNFNWWSTNHDSNYQLGAGLNWPVLPNVMLVASVLYTKTDGSADFASQNNFGSPLPITAYDDAKRSTLNLKGIWNVNRNWELTGGYAWEKYDYSDFQFNNYQNLNPPPPAPISTTTSYLTGYYAYPDYRAGILYLIGKYRF